MGFDIVGVLATVLPIALLIQPLASAGKVKGAAGTRPTIAFARLVSHFGVDQATWTVGHGILCMPSLGLDGLSDGGRMRAGRMNVKDQGFEDAFRKYVEATGLRVEGDPDNLFNAPSANQARYAVAGAITSVKARLCQAAIDTASVKGAATVAVEWQIYDRLKETVVAKITTPGTFVAAKFGHDNERIILFNAVGDSARALVQNETFISEVKPVTNEAGR